MHAFAAEVNFGNQFLKEMGIGLCALIVVRADVLKISAISEGVLGDYVHGAPIKIRVPLMLRRSEALTEYEIGSQRGGCVVHSPPSCLGPAARAVGKRWQARLERRPC